MKIFKKLFCTVLAICLLCANAYAAEVGSFPDVELKPYTAYFYRGYYPIYYSVSAVDKVSDEAFDNGNYTVVKSVENSSGDANYGTFDVVNRGKSLELNVYTQIGLFPEKLDEVSLTFKLKLDDVRNKNLKIYFSCMKDASGEYTLSGSGYRNETLRRDFVDEDGNKYISIADYIEETTEWQDVTVPLDLSGFTKMIHKDSSDNEISEAADWTKASAIHLVSFNTENAFAGEDAPDSFEICYGNMRLSYSEAIPCIGEISVMDEAEAGEEVTELTAGQTVYPTVKVTNNNSLNHKALVMYTVYEDDEMTALKAKYIDVEPNTPMTYTFEGVTLPEDVSDTELTVYLWTDFESMQPITMHLNVD